MWRPRKLRQWGLLGLATAWIVPGAAEASNGLHPRTPVQWNDTVCMELVDRTADPVYLLDYDIPFEDTEVTTDEVADSRTHQFFALCRQYHAQEYLPNWITWADLDAAAAKKLVDPGAFDDLDVFETSPVWADCWSRITEDDARRPITNAMADMDVPWDTSALPAGTYIIEGYTHEPAFNMWSSRHSGVIKIYYGGDPADIGPGGAVISDEAADAPFMGDTFPVEGCANALPGTTITAYYASTEGADTFEWAPQWVPFAEDVPLDGDTFSVDFIAPEEVAGQSVALRVDFTDPMDRTYSAHRRHLVFVVAGTNPNDCDTDGNFIGNSGCADGDSSGTGGGDTGTGSEGDGTAAATGTSGEATGEGDSGPGQDDDGGGGGCGCRSSGGAPLPWAGLVGLVGLALVGLRRIGDAHQRR